MKRKKLRLFLLAGLVALLGAGGTVAYLAATPDHVVNTFTPGEVSCAVIEDISDGATKKNVKIENTGNIDAYIRAAVVANWVDADGNVYGKAVPAAGTDYTITCNTTEWTKGLDGYYYCKSPVSCDEDNNDSPVLINSCVKGSTTPPTGYDLQVTILAEAIQADGETSDDTPAVTDAWGVAVVDGKLSVT